MGNLNTKKGKERKQNKRKGKGRCTKCWKYGINSTDCKCPENNNQ